MWCGFPKHFYQLLQDMEQRYPAPPSSAPPHWGLVFHCSQWSLKSDPAHPERHFPLVNDAVPKLCLLSWLHHHWLHWGLDSVSDVGTAQGRAESHPAPPQASRYQKCLQWSAPLVMQHTDSSRLHQPLPVPSLQTFLPAKHLLQRFQDAQQCYPYKWVAQVWITCTLISSYKQGLCCTGIRNRKQIWKVTHILIQNNSYKQHSFLKASMVI